VISPPISAGEFARRPIQTRKYVPPLSLHRLRRYSPHPTCSPIRRSRATCPKTSSAPAPAPMLGFCEYPAPGECPHPRPQPAKHLSCPISAPDGPRSGSSPPPDPSPAPPFARTTLPRGMPLVRRRNAFEPPPPPANGAASPAHVPRGDRLLAPPPPPPPVPNPRPRDPPHASLSRRKRGLRAHSPGGRVPEAAPALFCCAGARGSARGGCARTLLAPLKAYRPMEKVKGSRRLAVGQLRWSRAL